MSPYDITNPEPQSGPGCDGSDPPWHWQFLALLPAIRRHARLRLGGLRGEAREDALAEVTANACAAYARLAARGRKHVATAKSLAFYGVRQYRDGRRTGSRLNVRDVLSEHARRRRGLHVERLDRFDEREHCWREVLVEDGRTTPADLAASRLDFPAWLATLSARDRRIALTLAEGEPTGLVAQAFRLSAARVSQLRRQFLESWWRFHGERRVPAVA